jgi:hypothetical protein
MYLLTYLILLRRCAEGGIQTHTHTSCTRGGAKDSENRNLTTKSLAGKKKIRLAYISRGWEETH